MIKIVGSKKALVWVIVLRIQILKMVPQVLHPNDSCDDKLHMPGPKQRRTLVHKNGLLPNSILRRLLSSVASNETTTCMLNNHSKWGYEPITDKCTRFLVVKSVWNNYKDLFRSTYEHTSCEKEFFKTKVPVVTYGGDATPLNDKYLENMGFIYHLHSLVISKYFKIFPFYKCCNKVLSHSDCKI